MKNIILLSCVLAIFGCGTPNNGGTVYVNPPQNANSNVVVTPATSNIGDNLDLQALGELVKTSVDATDIEKKLNAEGSINNIDMDGDGKVDYITVTEYGSTTNGTPKGFSFSVDLANGEKQEVATIEIQQQPNQQATMNISGNNQVYGNNAYYSSNYAMSDFLLWHYIFMPHPYYHSPWHYGYYPSYYHYYRPIGYSNYSSRVRSTTTTTTIRKTTTAPSSSIKSPNSSSNSSYVQKTSRSLANPTSSQKSFQARSSNAVTPSTNGFSNKPTQSGPSRIATPSSSSSSRSYGSGSSSSSRSSSGSSFGSSSRSSSSSSSRSSGGRRR